MRSSRSVADCLPGRWHIFRITRIPSYSRFFQEESIWFSSGDTCINDLPGYAPVEKPCPKPDNPASDGNSNVFGGGKGLGTGWVIFIVISVVFVICLAVGVGIGEFMAFVANFVSNWFEKRTTEAPFPLVQKGSWGVFHPIAHGRRWRVRLSAQSYNVWICIMYKFQLGCHYCSEKIVLNSACSQRCNGWAKRVAKWW